MKKPMTQMISNIYGNMNNIFFEDDDKEPVTTIKCQNLNEDFFIAEFSCF